MGVQGWVGTGIGVVGVREFGGSRGSGWRVVGIRGSRGSRDGRGSRGEVVWVGQGQGVLGF